MDNFYDKVNKVSEANSDLSETEKAIVFIRVAVERSAGEVGWGPTMHLLSKLMTTTLGILADEESLSLEDPLVGFDIDGLAAN